MKKARKKIARSMRKQLETALKPIDLEVAEAVPKNCIAAYKNNRFIVTAYNHRPHPITGKPCTHALIQAVDGMPIKGHWRKIQKVKEQIFGDVMAIECYPPSDDLIDDFNIYWIWLNGIHGKIENE